MEKDLRAKAESLAQEMYIEQSSLKRQSCLLLQSITPDQQLLKALNENARLTHSLEEAEIRHQLKVKELEEQLQEAKLRKEGAEPEKAAGDPGGGEERSGVPGAERRDCSEGPEALWCVYIDELQKRLHQAEKAAAPPPPPPPPPLPPPPPPNPIRSLMSIIRKKPVVSAAAVKPDVAQQPDSGPGTCYIHLSRSTVGAAVSSPSSALTLGQSAARTNHVIAPSDLSVTAEDPEDIAVSTVERGTAGNAGDLKRQAVEEMMDRIKRGVHLRPIQQTLRVNTQHRSADCRARAALCRLSGSRCALQTVGLALRSADCRARAALCRLSGSRCALQTVGLALRSADCRARAALCRLSGSRCALQTVGVASIS
ncbi:unnamed protein product [Ranitomeya imitator]|uniref:Shootin-1 n=1 Tax=Ranitomeya imitator TaxID=111125 RepID=A0ABN9MIR7_9NEOB|nr:unnamed protein product [Ranitomeya imitator]